LTVSARPLLDRLILPDFTSPQSKLQSNPNQTPTKPTHPTQSPIENPNTPSPPTLSTAVLYTKAKKKKNKLIIQFQKEMNKSINQ
tara:strand:- start:502 stop:756 length:255 start_codon:yes stop_codon:yes gene_type:complete